MKPPRCQQQWEVWLREEGSEWEEDLYQTMSNAKQGVLADM